MNAFIPYFRRIFLILGNGCNKQCNYCIQHPLMNKQIDDIKINKDIYTFISDISNNQRLPLQLNFFGGEPFIYWNGLVDVVNNVEIINKKLDDSRKIRLSTFTNGTLFTKDKIDFLNKHKVHVTISWDGRVSEETRGYNPIKNKEIVNMILDIDSMNFNAVLSSKCLPLEYIEDVEKINEKYLNIHGYDIGFSMEEIMNTGCLNNSEFCDFDYDKLNSQMEYLCKIYKNNIINHSDIGKYEFMFIDTLVNKLKNNLNDEGLQQYSTVCCQNGYETINLDLEGNLYSCHNSSDKVGDIYMPYLDYMRKIIKTDVTKSRDYLCGDCDIEIMCDRACYQISDDELQNGSFCKLKRALYKPIIELVMSFMMDGDNCDNK